MNYPVVRTGAHWRAGVIGTIKCKKVKLSRHLTKEFIFFFVFVGKMVDINTWRCRIGTFSQKSKKVFQLMKGQGNKILVTCCYFSSFVVSLD